MEASKETAEDLAYFQGKGTSIGGMLPKRTIHDSEGALSLGKFPSVNDEHSYAEIIDVMRSKCANFIDDTR